MTAKWDAYVCTRKVGVEKKYNIKRKQNKSNDRKTKTLKPEAGYEQDIQ